MRLAGGTASVGRVVCSVAWATRAPRPGTLGTAQGPSQVTILMKGTEMGSSPKLGDTGPRFLSNSFQKSTLPLSIRSPRKVSVCHHRAL